MRTKLKQLKRRLPVGNTAGSAINDAPAWEDVMSQFYLYAPAVELNKITMCEILSPPMMVHTRSY